MTRLVCMGECMVELAPEGNGLFRQGFAGDSFNTAWALRDICPVDWQIGYATALGDDPLSARMHRFIADAGLCTDDIRVLPGKTCGLYMISLVAGERSFAYWRDSSAARHLADDPTAVQTLLQRTDGVFLSGITLAILPDAQRAALVTALERFSGQVFFDPNYRARLWDSAAQAAQWASRMAVRADIFLPSLDDCAALFDLPDAPSAAKAMGQLGAREVVVTDGAGPADIWVENSHHRVSFEPAAQPVDTSGAGDAFNAGYIATRLQNGSVEHAAHQGRALSQRAIMARGALLPPKVG